MKKLKNIYLLTFKTIITVILITSILFYFFYIVTDMGFVSNYSNYTAIYGPLWFEVLIVTISIPTFIGILIYNK